VDNQDKALEKHLEKLRDVIRISVPRREGQGPPEMATYTGDMFNDDHTQSPIYRNYAEIAPREVEWLWPGRIPSSMFTLLVGKQGSGKTFIALDIAARLSKSTTWPDRDSAAPMGRTILLAAEDLANEVISPRLIAMGADMGKITSLDAVRVQDENGKTRIELFDAQRRLVSLDVLIRGLNASRTLPPVRLIVLDPITAYMGDTDQNSNVEVRAALSGLILLAAKHKVAVLGLNHLNKLPKGHGIDTIDHVLGSTAFTALARSVLMIDPLREIPTLRHIKCNIGPLAKDLPCHTIDGKLIWSKPLTAKQVELQRIDELARGWMPHGWQLGKVMKDRALKNGVTLKQLRDWRQRNGIATENIKDNKQNGTIWRFRKSKSTNTENN